MLSITQTNSYSTRTGTLKYDDEGRVTRYSYTRDGKTNEFDYTYNGNNIEITHVHNSGTDTYSYTIEDGRVKSSNWYLAGDNVTEEFTYRYGEDKRMTEILNVTNKSTQKRTVYNWTNNNLTSMDYYKNDAKRVSTEYSYNQMSSEPLIHALFGFGEGEDIYIDEEFSMFAIYPYLGTLPQNLFSHNVVTDFLEGNRQYTYDYSYELDSNGDIVKITIGDTYYTLVWEGSSNSTGIDNVNLDYTIGASIYDLSGKKLATPQSGINIIGRKKVLVK